MHRRESPLRNEFRYGVYYVLLDVDELEALDRRSQLFGYERRRLVSFREADHFGRHEVSLRAAVERRLVARGFDPRGWSITLLTNARVLGYVFNPVSFYFCRDAGGDLRTVIAEVHNTQGEEHVYDLDLRPCAPGVGSNRDDRAAVACGQHFRATAEKAFYVSPFIDMRARYDFEFRIENGRYEIDIDESDGTRHFFHARLDVQAVPFNDRNLGWMLVRYPLVTAQTIGLIHWQALKLWRRGVRYRKNPRQVEVYR
jgi:DUF1365 family protein